MQKLYLFSLILVTIAIPFKMATHRSPARGLRRMRVFMLLYVVAWGIGAIYVYWRLPA